MAGFLLKRGACVNRVLDDESTFLQLNAQSGGIKFTRTSLKGRVNSRAKTTDGSAAVHLATANEHLDIVELLLEEDKLY